MVPPILPCYPGYATTASYRREAQKQVKNFPAARYKKLRDRVAAQEWINTPMEYSAAAVRGGNLPAPTADKGKAKEESGVSPSRVIVYTDGASKYNQDSSRRVAGYGIHWYSGHPNIVE
jgi:viroplasmin and RNaseH domain-containing protein